VSVRDEELIDPYGGYRELWSTNDLNASSQRSTVVFEHPVVRASFPTNQIAVPSVAHLECCGPTGIAICAHACGLIDDTVANILAALNFLGPASVARNGTNDTQLVAWARNQGWAVHVDNRPGGDLDEELDGSNLIACSAMWTQYGSGAYWNTLHPQAAGSGGTIGHWEVLGATTFPSAEDVDMTPAQLLNLKRIPIWMERLHHENWPSDPNAQENDIDGYARQIPDNLDFEGVITALHATFETNHQPSQMELLAAVRAKVGA
jgi:hypothetical protein